MSLHLREICKVGDSPSRGRRSASPRRMMSVVAEDDGETADHLLYCERRDPPPSPVGEVDSPRISPRLTPSPSSSTSSTPELQRSPSKGERRISTRLLLQKSDKPDSILSKFSSSTQQVIKSPKHAAWKTSKFFSRSMASGDLLKGLKKYASSPPPTTPTPEEKEYKDNSPGESSKSFKNRFSSLRRKSGSDCESVTLVDTESLELGSQEVRGIICKKADLLTLLNEVPLDRKMPSPSDGRPSPLPTHSGAPEENAPTNRGSFRTSRSASLDPTMVPNHGSLLGSYGGRVQLKTLVNQPTITRDPPPDEYDEISLEAADGERRLSGSILIPSAEKETESNGDTTNKEQDPAVQWDESNFVDPNLLGGVIEAFLKGMGSSPTAGSGKSEKRVSFKKS